MTYQIHELELQFFPHQLGTLAQKITKVGVRRAFDLWGTVSLGNLFSSGLGMLLLRMGKQRQGEPT